MIDVKFERTEIYRRRGEEPSGFEISYRLDRSNHWNSMDLTEEETIELIYELLQGLKKNNIVLPDKITKFFKI